jgi:hypothetical protein
MYITFCFFALLAPALVHCRSHLLPADMSQHMCHPLVPIVSLPGNPGLRDVYGVSYFAVIKLRNAISTKPQHPRSTSFQPVSPCSTLRSSHVIRSPLPRRIAIAPPAPRSHHVSAPSALHNSLSTGFSNDWPPFSSNYYALPWLLRRSPGQPLAS